MSYQDILSKREEHMKSVLNEDEVSILTTPLRMIDPKAYILMLSTWDKYHNILAREAEQDKLKEKEDGLNKKVFIITNDSGRDGRRTSK